MSSKIQVIPFQPEHLDKLDLKENYAQGECPKTVMTTAVTLMLGDEVVAVVGCFPFVDGVIHFWALVSKLSRKHPIDFHKTCLKILAWYEAQEKPRRMQMEVRVDYEMGHRWAKSLGMQPEGTLRCWGPDGADHVLYARVCGRAA